MPDTDQTRRDLTLMLMYLNSWIERDPGFDVRRFWKGYDFHDIDELEEQGLISQSKRAKSAYFREEGVAKVRELLAKYGIADPESEPDT